MKEKRTKSKTKETIWVINAQIAVNTNGTLFTWCWEHFSNILAFIFL
ncbi:unnamed protein product [Tenebrio molitor]|nr:unnamed protein product [Tenebrio molitor]